VGGGAPIARVSAGFIGLGSLTTSEAGGGTGRGIVPGVVTVSRSRIPVVEGFVGDGVVGLTRGAVVGLTRGTDCSSALWAKAAAVGTAAIRVAIASVRIRMLVPLWVHRANVIGCVAFHDRRNVSNLLGAKKSRVLDGTFAVGRVFLARQRDRFLTHRAAESLTTTLSIGV
jgi:hypothetical protein